LILKIAKLKVEDWGEGESVNAGPFDLSSFQFQLSIFNIA